MSDQLPGLHVRVRVVDDWSGSGHIENVIANDVLVWGWAHHIDGPMSHDARSLLDAIKARQSDDQMQVEASESFDRSAE